MCVDYDHFPLYWSNSLRIYLTFELIDVDLTCQEIENVLFLGYESGSSKWKTLTSGWNYYETKKTKIHFDFVWLQ